MKKQIFFLLLLAIFAGTSVYAQAPNLTAPLVNCITPQPVTCLTSDALHPVPGTPFTYSVTVPSPTNGNKTFRWFVTQDPAFIAAGTLTANREANNGTGAHVQATGTGYNDILTGTASIDITWKSFTHDPALPVFLVIYVTNDACATDNIQVYMIQPVHSFTLDIANIGIDGSTQANNFGTCASPVVGATFNPGSGLVEMDYGKNYMFFVVNAANFTDSWMPSFQVGGVSGTQVVERVDWATPANAVAGNWEATTLGGTTYTSTNPVMASGGAGTAVGSAGECIIVRVAIDNNQLPILVDEPITLAVDGIMKNPTAGDYTTVSFGDIHTAADGSGTCPWIDGFTNDVITQVINPRPDVRPVAPLIFVPKNDGK